MSATAEVIWTITCDEDDCKSLISTGAPDVTTARRKVERFGWRTLLDDDRLLDLCPTPPSPSTPRPEENEELR